MSFIGVFDSGLGGLSILQALQKEYPNKQFVYLADTANIPYGDKNIDELSTIFNKNIEFFNNAEHIIIACNTMSALIPLFNNYNKPISGMIDSLIKTTLQNHKPINNIGILATLFTVSQKIYTKSFKMHNPDINIVEVAAPDLVPGLENNDPDILVTADRYFQQFPSEITHIILGCTHYNLLLQKFQNRYPHLTFTDPYKGILEQVQPHINTLKNQNNVYDTTKSMFFATKYSTLLQKNSESILHTQVHWQEISL